MATAACLPRFSYQRLRYDEIEDELFCNGRSGINGAGEVEKKKTKTKMRLRMKKRRITIRIGRLKRWLMRRKASRAVAASLAKVAARLKESQNHFGDLFAGNYLFLQINPPTLYRH